MMVVIFSFVFYFSVFLSEALGITPNFVKKCFAKKHKTHLDKLIKAGLENEGEFRGSELHLEMNPLQTKMAEDRAAAEAKKISEAELDVMRELHTATAEAHAIQMLHLKKKVVQGSSGNTVRKRGKKKKGRKKKEMAQSTLKTSSKDDGNDEQFPLVSNAAPATGKKSLKKTASWKEVPDAATGKVYYHNVTDNSVSWSKPPDDEMLI